MIEKIRQEFIQIIKESDWMDKESKELALAKVGLRYFSSLTFTKNITHFNY